MTGLQNFESIQNTLVKFIIPEPCSEHSEPGCDHLKSRGNHSKPQDLVYRSNTTYMTPPLVRAPESPLSQTNYKNGVNRQRNGNELNLPCLTLTSPLWLILDPGAKLLPQVCTDILGCGEEGALQSRRFWPKGTTAGAR